MKRIIAAVACIVLAAGPFPAAAGQDEAQRQITQRLQEQKLKHAAAERTQGAERDTLMQEHMQVMQETMGTMREMAARQDTTQIDERWWIDEHQKLMEQMMGQMMAEHHLMLQGRPCK